MQIAKKTIQSSLLKKGFVKDNNDHTYFYHEVGGKRTGAYTYLSHGSKPKDYDVNLLKLVKRE